MGWTVYAEDQHGVLTPIGHSKEYGEAAIFDVLMRAGRDYRITRYVAYGDADGRELQVKG